MTGDDARIVMGNTYTGHPDCSGNYSAIGGEHDLSQTAGLLNFYVKDVSNSWVFVTL